MKDAPLALGTYTIEFRLDHQEFKFVMSGKRGQTFGISLNQL